MKPTAKRTMKDRRKISPQIVARVIRLLRDHPIGWVATRLNISWKVVSEISSGEFQTRRELSTLAWGDKKDIARCSGCGAKVLKSTLKPLCKHCSILNQFPKQSPCREPGKVILNLEPDQFARLEDVRMGCADLTALRRIKKRRSKHEGK